MKTEIGEYVVGAYLKIIDQCDFVDYNVRPPGGGKEGLAEFDVLGLNFKKSTCYLCEVTTHIRGFLYGKGNQDSVDRIKSKNQRQIKYARQYLKDFNNVVYMFWSPYVPEGFLTENLGKIKNLELVINKDYTAKIEKLKKEAKRITHDTGNPFFRTLQILERLR